MKTFRQIIFTLAIVAGLAFSVPAQSDDQKRPPKPKPPVVDPKPKPPRGNPPKGEDRPKKPGMSFFLVSARHGNDIA
jgi:hypothetical protein